MGLSARLALVFAVVAASTALVVGAASFAITSRQARAEIDTFLTQRVDQFTDGRRGRPQVLRSRDEFEPFDVATGDTEVQVLDRRGTPVANTGLLLPVDQTDPVAPSLRTVSIDGADYRIVTRQLRTGGAIQVARPLEETSALLRALRVRTFVFASLAAALAALAGWLVAQRTTRSLRDLTASVDSVAATRSFDVSVPVVGDDEVGRLARRFNEMLTTLEGSRNTQRRLVQDAAHELRTPLTSITANIDWLSRATDLDERSRAESLGAVRSELAELNAAIGEIVELATEDVSPAPAESVDLAAVVERSVGRFRRRTGREVETRTESVVVSVAPAAIERAIDNLLSNAEKFSDGRIRVVLDRTGLFVDDAGPGIPPEDRHVVFERFHRRVADRSTPGSGLGLAIVADVVERMGGRVLVDDSKLGGARVGFTFGAGEGVAEPTRQTEA